VSVSDSFTRCWWNFNICKWLSLVGSTKSSKARVNIRFLSFFVILEESEVTCQEASLELSDLANMRNSYSYCI